jgi:hypothetical protein
MSRSLCVYSLCVFICNWIKKGGEKEAGMPGAHNVTQSLRRFFFPKMIRNSCNARLAGSIAQLMPPD